MRRESVLVQNVLASLSLTFGLSLLLAVIVKVVAVGFDVPDTIPLLDLALVSLLGGLIASVFVLGVTVALSIGAVRREWDLDNLVAPTVSTLGDVVTIPALVIATTALGHGTVTTVLGWVLVVLALATVAASVRAKLEVFSVILRESVPVLAVALVLSTLAGYAIERQLSVFTALPALLVLQPAFVSSAGSLGGILPAGWAPTPPRPRAAEVRPSIEAQRTLLVLLIGLPVFSSTGSARTSWRGAARSPGLVMMVLATLIGGLAAVLFVIAVYYGSRGGSTSTPTRTGSRW